MPQSRSLTAQESLALSTSPGGPPQYIGDFGRKNWLAEMIFTAKVAATGAEFIPLPCVRAAFDAVVVFLETVDKIKRNREDLRELCSSTLEIVFILEEEIKMYGQTSAVRFTGLLETFISFLRFLQSGLEGLLQMRSGFLGRFQEIMYASRITDEINRYRLRLHDLRSNFLLVTTINTNLNVIGIQSSVAGLQIPRNPQFRNVALGDINLLYQTAITNKIHKINIFVARISGEHSTMTVAKYEDKPKNWQNDLDLYSRLRHPHVWQLFGISTATTFRALIFHDELIPLPIYRQFHRPHSDLIWSFVEAMLFRQFNDCSKYHRWSTGDDDGLEATICVKREPISICLTMPGFDLECEVDKIERMLSFWHSLVRQPVAPDHLKRISTIIADTTPPEKLFEHFNWGQFFTVLTPASIMWTDSWKNHQQFFLASVIRRPPQGSPSSPAPSSLPVAYIPNEHAVRVREWAVGLPTKSTVGHLYQSEMDPKWQRFTFPAGAFKVSEVCEMPFPMSSYIDFDDANTEMLEMSWLAQANTCIGPAISDGKQLYGVINTLGYAIYSDPAFKHLLHPAGIVQELYLFVPPIAIKYEKLRVRVDPPQSDYFYWSWDPAGTIRLSSEQCDSIGIPRLRLYFIRGANCWREYHYSAIREFSRAKGFDPCTYDLAQSLGCPLAEKELSDLNAV
ncbi:hypothetical protein B0H16DRAFT_1586638 [Mycena metata]|uniref:Uncharacterized protein n=1 Tax=Mycena metata TaxID=1033252 RepID=A0AAD7HW05_9AGAR|nr:hypothetical protein B0H16DRAFT_1586638 [Mycena metata]